MLDLPTIQALIAEVTSAGGAGLLEFAQHFGLPIAGLVFLWRWIANRLEVQDRDAKERENLLRTELKETRESNERRESELYNELKLARESNSKREHDLQCEIIALNHRIHEIEEGVRLEFLAVVREIRESLRTMIGGRAANEQS